MYRLVWEILAVEAGNPFLGESSRYKYSKLLENPTALNIPAGLSCETMINEKNINRYRIINATQGN